MFNRNVPSTNYSNTSRSFHFKGAGFCSGGALPKFKAMLNTPFQELVSSLSPAQVEYLESEMSKTKFTQINNAPARASNDELLLYAEVLQITPYELLLNYHLGADKVTLREQNQHRVFFILEGIAAQTVPGQKVA